MKLKEFLETYKEELKGFNITSINSRNEITLENYPYVCNIEIRLFKAIKTTTVAEVLRLNPIIYRVNFEKISHLEYTEKVNYGIFGMRTIYRDTGEIIKMSLNEKRHISKYIIESTSKYGKIITYTNNMYYYEHMGFFLDKNFKPRNNVPFNNTEGPAVIFYDKEGRLIKELYYFNGKLCEDPLKIAVFKAVKEGDNNEN